MLPRDVTERCYREMLYHYYKLNFRSGSCLREARVGFSYSWIEGVLGTSLSDLQLFSFLLKERNIN